MYGNGGILGGLPPKSTGAPGVWRLGEIACARADEVWPTEKDASFSSVIFLDHFDGVDGAEHFRNMGSGTPGLISTNSPTSPGYLSATQKKFGRTSLYISSSAPIVRSGSVASTAYALGAGDWTVEFWIYPTSLVNGRNLFDMRTGGINGAFLRIYCQADGGVRVYVSSADRITSAAGALVTNQWQFIACARVSGTTRLFIDGKQVGSDYTDGTTYGNASINCACSGGGGSALPCYFDELRVTKGVGRYSSGFTPPTKPFPDY